jgi:hypothetical protein
MSNEKPAGRKRGATQLAVRSLIAAITHSQLLAQSGHTRARNECLLLTPPTGSSAGSAYHFITIIVVVIRHETTAATRWALPLIVRTLFNDAIPVALWTSFHGYLPMDTIAT